MDDGKRPFVCELCGSNFKRKEHCDRHKLTVHEDIRPYQCDICSATFKSKDYMKRHVTTCERKNQDQYSYSESSLKVKYEGKVCRVPNCNNKEGLDIVRFFKIIRQDKAQTEKWIQAIKRKNTDGTLWMPTKNNKICSEHFQSGRPSNDVNHPDYIPSKFSFRNQKLGRSRSKAMQRNASLKKESELLKPPVYSYAVVKLHEKEKQYDCGICHETFDEVPLFKAHARSVHAGHKAPFFTISFKEKGKSVKAPTSTPVNSPTKPIQLNLTAVPMQLNLSSDTNGYQPPNVLDDYEEKKVPTNLMQGNLPVELMPLDFPTEPMQFDLPSVPMQLNLLIMPNDYQSSNLLDLPTDPLQLNFPTEPMQLNLPTVPLQIVDYSTNENLADLENKDDLVNVHKKTEKCSCPKCGGAFANQMNLNQHLRFCKENIATNIEKVIEPQKKFCWLENCRNREGMVGNIRFFYLNSYRANQSQFESWMQAINPDGSSWVSEQHAMICGQHFKTGKPSKSIEHPSYIPSLFLPRKLDPPRKLDIVAKYEGKKPFQCDICSVRYTTKENLNRHFLIEHD